jgi:hypothetical protein
MIKIIAFLSLNLLFILLFVNNNCYGQITVRQERNLTAFTKLFGYVRYFYPGDEAQQISWDQFAIYGSHEVFGQPNDKALINKLSQLYLPLAPTIKIVLSKKALTLNLNEITPARPDTYKVVSWQHRGYSYSGFTPPYASIRINRRDAAIKAQEIGNFIAVVLPVEVMKFVGRKFSFTAKIKCTTTRPNLVIKLLKDSFVYDRILLKPKSSQNIIDTLEREYRFQGMIDQNDKKIVFGVLINSAYKVSVNDFHFNIIGGEKTIELPLSKPVSYNSLSPKEGIKRYGLLIDDNTSDKPLFSTRSVIGESINTSLVPGINCMVPLALYENDSATYPKSNVAALSQLKQRVVAIKISNNMPLYQRLGCIIIAWNVFEHFFPYWQDASKSPAKILHNALVKTISDKNHRDFFLL